MSSPDEFTPEMVEALADLQSDPTIDPASTSRKEDGWVKFYVECPECQVPMAQTTLQSKTIPSMEKERRSKAEFHCICPACGAIETNITVYRRTAPYGEKYRRNTQE